MAHADEYHDVEAAKQHLREVHQVGENRINDEHNEMCIRDSYKEAFRKGLPGYEHEFRAFVGPRTHWLREQVSIKPLEAGLFELVGVITDVSDRREAETALAAEKERLAVTLRAMAEGVITTDPKGCILFINPVAASLAQCDAANAVGRAMSDVCSLRDAKNGALVGISRDPSALFERVANLPPQTQLVTRSGTCLLYTSRCV